ncbi:MAG: electron transport complex subunit E [Planctomycetes bacterium]|nr:electron transport complex subunit E [Planctomycetota bacterium]
MKLLKELTKGIFRENPTFVLVLGLCPTLAVTVSVVNGFWMAIATTAVLVCSNVIISSLRRFIPQEIRIPCFIVVIASFVTMADLTMQAYLSESINKSLGIFIPLIVVNCIILGRAEAFAAKHSVFRSFLDGLGSGIGFLLALLLISAVREVIGSGALLGLKVSKAYQPAYIMIMAPGAFLVMGLLLGVFNTLKLRRAAGTSAACQHPVTAVELKERRENN